MNDVAGRIWKQVLVMGLLVALDLTISLPIMGATYRPFSWMSIAPADAATLYPVIQHVSVANGAPRVRVSNVTAGANVVLERTTNLLDRTVWTRVASTTAADQVILLIDTNPISRAVFYRVKQILGETP